ncbi:three prime repair exonuclease 2-like [Petromyzon marinus]
MEPNKVVDAEAGRLTGLTNDILAQNRRRPFDARAARLVLDFLARQAPPVCLVAHNGIQFDFPLLKDELSSVGETLPPGTLCADTLPAMRQIMAHNSPWPTPELAQPPPGEHSRKRKLLARGRGRGRGRGYANDYGYEDPNSHRKVAFGKKNKFRLGDIYVQFFGHEPPVGLHNAETDTMALLSIAQHCAPQLLAWMDLNARPIADVQPLYQPAPPKDGTKKEEGEEDDDVIVLL